MQIIIEDLKFQAILGILDFERNTPQDIIINLSIDYHYTTAFINYAEVAELIISTMKSKQFFLIEDALTSLSSILKENFSQINKLHLKITKPSILPNCRVSVADSYIFDS